MNAHRIGLCGEGTTRPGGSRALLRRNVGERNQRENHCSATLDAALFKYSLWQMVTNFLSQSWMRFLLLTVPFMAFTPLAQGSCPGTVISDGDQSSVLFPTGEALNTTFTVTGTFYVNNDLVFMYCVLFMEPGAQIIVEPGFIFDLSATRVQACTQMWRGIYLEPGGTLWITTQPLFPIHSDILDAENAITAQNGCWLFMDEAYFENNRVCVYVPPVYPGWNNITVFAKDCTFQSSGPLAPPYPGQTTTLGQLGYAAFDVNDMTLSLTGWYNFIHSYSNGIIANRTNLTIDGFVTAYIQPDLAYPHYANGSGIRAFGWPLGDYTLTQTGYGGVGPNDFEYSRFGIYAERMNVRSSNNRMVSMGTAHRVDFGRARTIDILDNVLDSHYNTIDLRYNDYSTWLIVEDNDIVFGDPDPLAKGYIAISSVEGNASFNNFSVIRFNEIHFRAGSPSARSGIRLNAATNYQVYTNDLYMTSNVWNYAGVITNGCQQPFIGCNNVQGSFNNYGVNEGQSAIRNEMGSRPTIYCNEMDGTTNGIYFSGEAYGTDVGGNNMRNHKWALHLDNSAVIEQQDFKGNLWYNNPQIGGVGAWYENAINALAFPIIYDPTLVGTGDPEPPTWDPPNWFQPQTGQNFLCADHGTGLNYCGAFDWDHSEGLTTLDERIALDYLENDPFTDETQWRLKGELFSKLEEHPDYLVDDAVLADFHTAVEGTAIAEFRSVSWAIQQLALPEAVEAYVIQQRTQVQNWMVQLEQATEQLGDSTLTRVQRQVIHSAVSDLRQVIHNVTSLCGEALQLADSLRDQSIDAILVANDGITTSTQIEQNEKLVNEIYLSTIAKDVNIFTVAQAAELLSIAEQCPMAGGNAVFRARGMYSLINDEQEYNDPAACLPFGFIVRSVHQYGTNSVQIMPNPADGEVTLTYALPEGAIGTFVLMDATGREVRRYELGTAMNRLVFSTIGLNAGPYHFLMFSGEGMAGEGRLVIIH